MTLGTFFYKVFCKLSPRGLVAFYDIFFKDRRPSNFRKDGLLDMGAPLSLSPIENVTLEKYVRIHPNVRLIASDGKLIVKKYSEISVGTVIVPGTHTPTVGMPEYLSPMKINDKHKTIQIDEDCWIGAGCMLLLHAHVGRGCVVGARSLVTKAIPPYAVVAGTPARIIASRFTEEQVLEHERILYPPEERLSEEYVHELFATHYAGLNAIGTAVISDEDRARLEAARLELGIGKWNEAE